MPPKKKKGNPRNESGVAPFKSKYRPHADFILERRSKGDTWDEIKVQLEELGVENPNSPGICTFVKSYLSRPFAIGQEPIRSIQTNQPTKQEDNNHASEEAGSEKVDPWDIDPYKHIDVEKDK